MIKRPQRGETEDDILRMQNEFLSQRAKNPKLQPAAQCVQVKRDAKKSFFLRAREMAEDSVQQLPKYIQPLSSVKQEIMGEIHEKIVGNLDEKRVDNFSDVVLGDVVEKKYNAPKQNYTINSEEMIGFPTVKSATLEQPLQCGKSLFASNRGAIKQPINTNESVAPEDLSEIYGDKSVIVSDSSIGAEVHKENLAVLSKMNEDNILAEREKLLNSIDPTLLDLLRKKRKEKLNCFNQASGSTATVCNASEKTDMQDDMGKNRYNDNNDMDISSVLSPSNAALEILQKSDTEKWIHFDVVETDKLKWMRDIEEHIPNVKPGDQFEARFDWKGVLLPYLLETTASKSSSEDNTPGIQKDDRELYFHGEEPNRPGYTLQELFRLARSNIMQQRIYAFRAIGGILNIYNQGLYDSVLELPISKIFFLLRFGFDDNTPAMLEIVSKALARLFYNEADEILLDFIFDNPSCHWQPVLDAVDAGTDMKDINALESLQKQMQQLQMNDQGNRSIFQTDFEENESDSNTSMSDFQLAETNLIECLMRANILQRIYFILHAVKPENSTVSSCLQILIRLARTSKDIAGKIVSNQDLMHSLFEYFLPDLGRLEANVDESQLYYRPQFLCLKLLRVLITQNLGIAVRLMNMKLSEMLTNYLSYRGDIQDMMIKVQIECLRIVRCLLLLRIDDSLYGCLDSAFYYMLQWHCNYLKFEVGGPYLIRQHASALLMAISSEPCSAKSNRILSEMLNKCCCAWYYRATRSDVTEFSQATLLSACLNVVIWGLRRDEEKYFQEFIAKYLRDFLHSESFKKCVYQLNTSSVILRKSGDRRFVHSALPNVGAVLLHEDGPQLIIPQTYAVYLLSTLWSLLELQIGQTHALLMDALLTPQVVDSFVQYISLLSTGLNYYLSSNFFSKIEVKFIYKLLSCSNLLSHFNSSQILQLVYSYVCCLGAEYISEIEQLFDRIIFNPKYINVSESALDKWKTIFIGLVQSHYIIVEPSNLSLSKSMQTSAILSHDWPYFFFKIILQNYIDNAPNKITVDFSEREVLEMTLTLVTQLEESSSNLEIVTPTEELMYAMTAFMGPESEFLTDRMRPLLRKHLLRLYEKHRNQKFDFEKASIGKCKFESLYSLFADHFQATSYGDELFGSLVLVPMAQKYDSKWRRRMWSDYAPALCYLNCDESLLINGLRSYLEPFEEDTSLIKAYAFALTTNDVRPGTIPYKIAKYHVEHFKAGSNK
ncbi:RNA polymerase II-associated protein 1 isoform X1 [Anastrepha ludens]|uniref:RNA polymerase II-associated protein 1 isoform X1 n=1 Tax=Anastrepha ludens TaxID=28586 RepID=UPI0023AEB5DD|nr:RNA polymerase II-associated protein 1 isoform X1 [Anastrepha ludens]